MYIIDKNKDYYDYHSHVYGVDTQIVLDRRGSIILTDKSLLDLISFERYGIISYTNPYMVLLEIGYIQYLLKISDIKKNAITDEVESCRISLAYTYKNNMHYFKAPISIRQVLLKYYYRYKYTSKEKKGYKISGNFKEDIKKIFDRHIDYPILAKTQITSLISSRTIWEELQNYISSLNNDRHIETVLSDKEKAVIHGFDNKYSFRNPIK